MSMLCCLYRSQLQISANLIYLAAQRNLNKEFEGWIQSEKENHRYAIIKNSVVNQFCNVTWIFKNIQGMPKFTHHI